MIDELATGLEDPMSGASRKNGVMKCHELMSAHPGFIKSAGKPLEMQFFFGFNGEIS